MTEEKYEALCKLAQFGDAEGENAAEQLEEFHYEQTQQSAYEVRQEPTNYLSYSERGWSLISQGMPLCAPTDKATAEQVANRHKITLPTVYWNGLEGRFTDQQP